MHLLFQKWLSLASHQDTRRSLCVCVTVSGDSWRFLPSVTERLWLPECDQPLVCLPLQPCSLACPATLLVARSPLSIYTAYGSGQLETCSVQLGAAASWASPSFLHTSSPFLSDGRGLSLTHAHNHASTDGRTIPGSEATPHIYHTPMLLHLHTRGQTDTLGVASPARRHVWCLASPAGWGK